jgi:Mn-dependent DtxR family transcriptional regulator
LRAEQYSRPRQIAARLDARESDVTEALEALEDEEEVMWQGYDSDTDEPRWRKWGGV